MIGRRVSYLYFGYGFELGTQRRQHDERLNELSNTVSETLLHAGAFARCGVVGGGTVRAAPTTRGLSTC